MPRSHRLHIYYEDTDFSGVVYHANYLKYFERGREHYLGIDEIKHLFYEDGLGFVVYRIELSYRKAAKFGDEVEVRTAARVESPLRISFRQSVWKGSEPKPLVEGQVELACVNRQGRAVPIPRHILQVIAEIDPVPRIDPGS